MPRKSRILELQEAGDKRLEGFIGTLQRRVARDSTGAVGDVAAGQVSGSIAAHDGASAQAAPWDPNAVYPVALDRIAVGGVNTRVIDEDDTDFQDLVDSFRRHGQLSPVLIGVEGDHFRLIAGERRFRAAQALGWETILARVLTVEPGEWQILMLVENLHRKDLEPWEEAAAYRALLARGLTLEAIGEQVGKGKSHISMVLKLTRNPQILAALEAREIPSMSLARELSPLVDKEGHPVQPSVVDEALAFIRRHHPTVPELRQWVQRRLSGDADAGEVPLEGPSPPAAKRRTFLLQEEQRLQGVMARRAPRLSSVEIELLAGLYERYARELRALGKGGGHAEANVPTSEHSR